MNALATLSRPDMSAPGIDVTPVAVWGGGGAQTVGPRGDA
ncbi:hypothetical protein J3A65_003072 [Rhizobium sp. PvP014]|nr:hypothetical protein [Rhizobium sp. PvP014]